ncbi:YoaK family protein [Streptomyces sp. NPDC047072]|uniref:YoaK family protein n=1 Tax=Streptomyces sp. NPDC047072 TaxID=3154809 RepID=UPI0033C1ED26
MSSQAYDVPRPATRPAASVEDAGTGRVLVPLLVLTLLSGVIDAVSLLGLGHVFVANMTGNLVLAGLALVGSPGASLSGAPVALGGFLAGTLLVRAVAPHHVGPRTLLGLCAALETALSVGAATAWSYDSTTLPILLCAVALGAQNAAVRRVGVPGMTTTVMTSTLTGLFADRAEGRVAATSRRQALSVLTLVAGAALGAVVVRESDPRWALLGVAVLAAVAAVALLVWQGSHREENPRRVPGV